MALCSVKLKNREEIAEGTMAFYFERPEGFIFNAGQHVVITLQDPPETDDEGNRRVFCIASAPYEEDLMVAMRMRDTAFKRVLKILPLGSKIQIDGPYGSFLLHTDSLRPAVFLSGGIGITPVRSMLFQAAHDQLAHKLFLFYSNRRPEEAAFLGELKILEHRNKNYKIIPTMTDFTMSRMPWNGERSYINKEMLVKYIKDLSQPIYYISGPPIMVLAMRAMLLEAGVEEQMVESDQFSGY